MGNQTNQATVPQRVATMRSVYASKLESCGGDPNVEKARGIHLSRDSHDFNEWDESATFGDWTKSN